jgi:NitT/TauT family transport system permease protein
MILTPKGRERVLSVLSPIGLILLWELTVQTGLLDQRLFVPPSRIAAGLYAMTITGEIWTHISISLFRVGTGFVLGAVPGIVIGIVMGLSRTVRALLQPIVAATYPIPRTAILPLFLIIFGLGEASKIVIVATGVFYPVLINAVAGVREINRVYLDVGHNFGASRWQVFRTIAFPGALPLIMSGVKLGIGMGLILIAIAEMVGAKNGLGYMIWNAWEVLSVETMYVGLLVIAIIGFLLSVLLNEFEAWMLPWKRR